MSGRAKPTSDVDIAILYQRGQQLGGWERLEQQAELAIQLKRELDWVILNDASPIIRMQVLQNGELLINNNSRSVNEFFVRTLNEYNDVKIMRQLFF